MSQSPKIFPRVRLAKLLKQIRSRRRIVFTNGCFDLLHLGHVRLFQKARSLGDVLVVGLNSDASLKKLKGPKRPLVPEKARAQVLAALACVDYVTIFGEDTPAELIAELKPHVLIKGGDYALKAIVGRDQVEKVVRFPLVRGFSTSALIAKVVKAYGRRCG